ncbi:MAG TPA: hypothetical protein VFD32_10440 [Dehalococcoidia bacterium]|nr:hypothetical protein [Dehalococcoidia bacterium]
MNQERLRVLELLEQGKITAAEAAELLRALGDEDDERGEPNGRERRNRRDERERDRFEGGRRGLPRWFRVRVTDTRTGRMWANVSIPYGMVNSGLRFAPGNFPFGHAGLPLQMDDLLSALRSGRRGTIYDVTDSGKGQRIEIIVD